jgi:hypothetical protein
MPLKIFYKAQNTHNSQDNDSLTTMSETEIRI